MDYDDVDRLSDVGLGPLGYNVQEPGPKGGSGAGNGGPGRSDAGPTGESGAGNGGPSDEDLSDSKNIILASDEDFDSALASDGSDSERPANRDKGIPFRPNENYNPEFVWAKYFQTRRFCKKPFMLMQ